MPRHQDRYHTIGFDPAAIFSAKGDSLKVEGSEDFIELLTGKKNIKSYCYNNVNPYQLLSKNFPQKFSVETHQGGLIGYACHEAINYFEDSINLPEHAEFDTFKFGLFLDGLIYDTLTGTIKYYSYGVNRSDQVRNLVRESLEYNIPEKLDSVEFLGHSTTREEYIEAVERTRKKIVEGYSFQSEVGFKSFFSISGDKLAIYNRLRQINPSPYMYYLKFDGQELLGASPEILVSSKQGIALTTPTAGTIIRGKTEQEDTVLARTLLNDPKEIAEHNMLVDLHRNDLARVSKAGSVKVLDLMFIIKFSHVQHIVSEISSSLLDNKNAFDLLSSVLPGGVTTGAPKLETIKIIHETEEDPRGPYGGAVGRFSFNGDCDFCLPIRSIFCNQDSCFAQTSAGIVFDSIAENEYIEVTHKLAAMIATLEDLGAKI